MDASGFKKHNCFSSTHRYITVYVCNGSHYQPLTLVTYRQLLTTCATNPRNAPSAVLDESAVLGESAAEVVNAGKEILSASKECQVVWMPFNASNTLPMGDVMRVHLENVGRELYVV